MIGFTGSRLGRGAFIVRSEFIPPPPTSAYTAVIEGIEGLVSRWGLSEQDQIIDHFGAHIGTYDAIPEAVAALPADSDGATRFDGTQAGTIPNAAGLQRAEMTLSFWFSVDDPERTNNILVSKDNTGFDNGDFATYTLPGGILRCSFQWNGASHVINYTGIAAATTYHVAITAGALGFTLWVDGQLIETNVDHVGAWSLNDNPIQFGAVFWTSFRLAGVLDEVCLYDRILTGAEIAALSQNTADPITVDDAKVIPESTTNVLGTIDLCTFAGSKSSLTVQIWNGSTWVTSFGTGHGTASVTANKDLQFAAAAVTANQTDAFDYRITDVNGTSNTSTVSMSIQETSTPPPSGDVGHLINFFPTPSGALSTVTVSSMTAMQDAVNAAPAGRHILIQAGTYSGGTLSFTSSQGTQANPIVVRPAGARGSVIINGGSWDLTGSSKRLAFTNLYFNNGHFEMSGANLRVSRCRFQAIDRNVINWYGLNCRVDHCDISDHENTPNDKYFVRFTSAASSGLLYDHNYFHAYTTGPDNHDSTLFSTSSDSSKSFDIWVDHCLWLDVGNNERIMTIKNSDITIRFCTFDGITNTLQQRQGGGWELRSCWFEQVGTTNFIIGHDDNNAGRRGPLYIGNRFTGGISMWVCSGNEAAEGAVTSKSYHPSHDARVLGNILETGTISVGKTFPDIESLFPAVNTLLAANIRNGQAASTSNGYTLVHQTGTTIQATTSESYTAAVKLTPSDVGMGAPDPFCPTGPQT